MLFYFFLFLLFLSETFHISSFPRLSFCLSLVFILTALLKQIIKNKKIFFPKSSIFFAFFLVFSGVSIFFAIDKQVAFKTTLTYISAFLIFILTFNYKEKLKPNLSLFIIYSSIIFILIFLFGKLLKLNFITEGSSLFYSGLDHSQWSNYLVLGGLAALNYFLEKKKSFFGFLFIIFLFFLLVNYSRTGYLALFIGILMLINQYKNKGSIFKTIVTSFSLFILLLFFLISNKDINLPKQLSLFRNFLITKVNLPSGKEFLGKRNIYFLYSLSSITEKPLFGVGPGNFQFASLKRQLYYDQNTTTAHNIILDILVENGLIAGAFLLLFLIYTFIKAKKDIYFYLLSSLTIIFLFDFSYRFDSFLFLWFVLLGLVTEDKKNLFVNNYLVMFFTLIIYQPILLGQFLLNIGHYKEALIIYPFQKTSYTQLIEKAIQEKNYKKIKTYLVKFDELFKGDIIITLKKAEYHDILGEREKAVYFYEKKINLYPFSIVSNKNILDRILTLNISLYGRDLGRKKTAVFLKDILSNINKEKKDSPLVYKIKKFCLINDVRCFDY